MAHLCNTTRFLFINANIPYKQEQWGRRDSESRFRFSIGAVVDASSYAHSSIDIVELVDIVTSGWRWSNYVISEYMTV
jgi:hypothetical protein